ncbi:unnamed protein product (macronuclear) [Paramecium tetraurelia]|uniref:Rab-GAP TBC domain-containing protein n=1 Tax=Paramecium tetraurelia TaxID=5888 RepID=A0BSC3_PARTE|nr:uncharacterized protein GSPATT00031671001 [Paramecium tetraurelia]CAK61440.1 unnamed protein product [Paramecium tetraurelia]|eukprot:XP_001428838.1 hypothetical protein (macronuclear) [Paramecium tetraurelia strain d4-2]
MQQYSPRAIVWMTYLNYLPQDQAQQLPFLKKQQQLYNSYLDELIKKEHLEIFTILNNIDSDQNSLSFNEFLNIKTQVVNSCMDFHEYNENEQLYELIEKDVPRTLPKQSILKEQTNAKFSQYFFTDQYKRRKQQNDTNPTHADILMRILYIYGKLNPAIKYMQGMSDLLAPLYLIIKNETDTFFCFTKIMAQIKDAYISTLDFTNTGIRGLLLKFEKQFQQKEPKLYSYLHSLGIHPYMYGYRWIITCMTREFYLDQIYQIWDLMLHDRNIHDFIIKFAISILKYLKPQLIEADFKLAFDILIYSEKDVNQILNFM